MPNRFRTRGADKRYSGPPGDDATYWLPRDRDELDAAWDAYFREHPDRDPSRGAYTPEALTEKSESPTF